MLNCAYCTQIMVLLDLNKDMSKLCKQKKNLLRTWQICYSNLTIIYHIHECLRIDPRRILQRKNMWKRFNQI